MTTIASNVLNLTGASLIRQRLSDFYDLKDVLARLLRSRVKARRRTWQHAGKKGTGGQRAGEGPEG